MMATFWIALKDLRLLGRDRMALFWVLGFPLLFAAFFGSVMKVAVDGSGSVQPRVMVVSQPHTDRSERIATGLRQAGLRVELADHAAAHAEVLQGRALAFVDADPGQMAAIEIGVDPARRAEAVMLRSLALQAVAREYSPADPILPNITEVAVNPDGVQGGNPAGSGARPRSGFEIVFPAMVLWGLMGCAATFAVSLVSERSGGTLQRLRAAPIPRASILGGKAAACIAACTFDAGLLTLLGHLLLDIRIDDGAKLAAAIGATVLCFAGLTMVMAVLGRTEQSVGGAGWSALIILAMLGGAMVPLAFMPPWLVQASDLSPVKWGITALEGATWRAADWAALARPIALLCGVGTAGMAFGALVLSRREV